MWDRKDSKDWAARSQAAANFCLLALVTRADEVLELQVTPRLLLRDEHDGDPVLETPSSDRKLHPPPDWNRR
jgi:hypothetical protein